jgi:hypothetical protein
MKLSFMKLFFTCLAFAIERKIALVGDACSRPPITIKSHNLHVGNTRVAMGEIASYHKRN